MPVSAIHSSRIPFSARITARPLRSKVKRSPAVRKISRASFSWVIYTVPAQHMTVQPAAARSRSAPPRASRFVHSASVSRPMPGY